MVFKGPSGRGDLTDGRKTHDFRTRWPREAWYQIAIEGIYLVGVLLLGLFLAALSVAPFFSGQPNAYHNFVLEFFGPPDKAGFIYLMIANFGAVGGVLFAIKWFVHGVAKGSWNADRLAWRLFTPLTGAATAIFFGLVVQSGIISLFNPSGFGSIELAAAFGMLVGYFADGVIGVLTNMANVLFGTVQDRNR